MRLKGIIRSLVLLCLVAGARSKPQCAVTIPAAMKMGEMAKACVYADCEDEFLQVDMIIGLKDVNHTVFSGQVPRKTQMCPEFQVPILPESAPVFLQVIARGTDYEYTETQAVVLARTKTITVIQLAKPIYKPGETGTDSSGNRLYQWKDKQTLNSMLPIEFELLDDAPIGTYYIQVETGKKGSTSQISRSFEIEAYVLPNMKLEISAPNLYYPGQHVKILSDLHLDENGTYSGTLDLTNFQLERSGHIMAIKIDITVTELGLGVQVTESKTIGITSQLGRVYFNRENMETNYKKQLPYYVECTALDGLGNPIIGKIIELQVNGVTMQNLTTDANGKAKDYIDTSMMQQAVVNIQAIYKTSEQCYDSTYVVPSYSNDYHTIRRFYSRSGCFVQIEGPKEELQCGQTYTLTISYIFSKSGLKDGENQVSLNYMIMSKLIIEDFGTLFVDLTDSLKGQVTLILAITPDHAPIANVIVYALLKEEVVAHTIQFNVEKCFKNQISMNFSVDQATPGSNIDLNILSAPRSVCGVRIYDSSLLLLKQDQPLTPAGVYASLQYISLYGYYAEGYSVDPPSPPCTDPNKEVMIDGLWFSPHDSPEDIDVFELFQKMGMLMITNTSWSKPTLCGQPRFFGRPNAGFFEDNFLMASSTSAARFTGASEDASFGGASNDQGAPATIESVRTKFADMWLFDVKYTNEDGSLSIPLEVPGTITKWEGDMVCLSGKGIGMTKNPSNFTAFQPFFASMSLPYSIVRGEDLKIKITVVYYPKKCAVVALTIKDSEDFTIEVVKGNDNQCICNGQRATFSFTLKAKSLGVVSIEITAETLSIGDTCGGPADPNEPKYKDTLVQTLIIEAEGIAQEETKSSFICVKNGENAVTEVTIVPPARSVQDATTAKISVIGEILGRALKNPESTIVEPTGCGEQNLAKLLPIAAVIKCLNVTGRLTEEMKAKAVRYMEIGYRRQMGFWRPDGSFSAFQNGQSSSELTVKTLETFLHIKEYVDVEDRVTRQAMVHLERCFNKTTGGFTPVGTLFNNALRGGAEDDVGFTAQMAVVMIQAKTEASPTLLRQAMSFLDAAAQREQPLYNMAMMFYVYRLAGYEDKSIAMFDKLKPLQIENGGTIYWERSNKQSQSRPRMFPQPAESANTQITAIILFACALKPSPSPADLSYMSQIALWLAGQQNGHGSYSNTMDTMMVLQALGAYSALVHQKDASNTVTVKYGGEEVKTFNLDPQNRDLFQTQTLTTIPGDYSTTVSGNGCVLVQTTVKYHMPVVNDDGSAFSLWVNTPLESCVNGEAPIIPMNMNISYNGPEDESNMVLIDLAMLTGYTPEQESLSELKSKVAKVEQKNNHLIVYLDKVKKEEVTALTLKLQMGARVQNMQAKHVYCWDYYKKEENALAVIRHPCTVQ